MSQVPRLADVQCSRMSFENGDKILVKMRQPSTSKERDRIRRTIERWAGDLVEVLVVDLARMDLEIIKRG